MTTGKTLEEYRQARALKVLADMAKAEAQELECFQLEEKFETQGLVRGVDFEILMTEVGNFVVRKPEQIVAKQFLEKDGNSVEDAMRFVEPSILHPERDAFRAVCIAHGGIVHRTTRVALALYEAKKVALEGKF